jgi:hypothetical protein
LELHNARGNLDRERIHSGELEVLYKPVFRIRIRIGSGFNQVSRYRSRRGKKYIKV